MAAVLAAGIDGIQRRLEPPPATTGLAWVDETSPKLPRTLDEALTALEQDEAMTTCLREEFVRLFLAVKRHEVAKARDAVPEYGRGPEWLDNVTDLERENLFEYL